MSNLEERLEALETRNRRVDLDKTWERSLYRRVLILVITYILLGIYMSFLGVRLPWLNAVVPTTGFLLSTLTLNWAKNRWLKRQ